MKSYTGFFFINFCLCFICFVTASCRKADNEASVSPSSVARGAGSSVQGAVPLDRLPVLTLPTDDLPMSNRAFILKFLGHGVPQNILNIIANEGQSLPSQFALQDNEIRATVMWAREQVSAVLYLKSDVLVAIAYALPVPLSDENSKLEANLLTGYVFQGEDLRSALSRDFESEVLKVKKYSYTSGGIFYAATFSHMELRTLAFYDPKAVNYQALLPASPEEIGEDQIARYKAKAAKNAALINEAREARRLRQGK